MTTVLPITGDDAPFWAGSPDAAGFEARHDERLARARTAIAALERATAATRRDQALQWFDTAVFELDAAASQASLIQNVHPEAAVREAAERVSQKAAALGTELSLNRAVYDALARLDLSDADAETRHYVDRTLRDFRLSGVDRDPETRARVAKLREELVTIGQEFSRNIRGGRRTVSAASAAELAGLPADYVARHPAGPDGTITISTDYPDAMPVLSYADDDDLRRRLHFEFQNRAYPANVPVLRRLLERRHELARVLGFASWADLFTADKMVESRAAVAEFVERIAALSADRAATEYQELLEHKRRRDPNAPAIPAWEAAYAAERLRRDAYQFDAQLVRPYFPFERVKQGVLDLSARLYGVTFERADAPVWHPSVECWEVVENGQRIARFYLDLHPRADKFSHAAEFDARTGVAGGPIPEAALVCNFPGGQPNDPGLMEHADVRTLFHEFGHLFHALFGGRRRWCGVGGIRTEADFTEVPSQLYEEWVWDPKSLATFARHVETNEPIPADVVRRMKRASEFGKGLSVRRQMYLAKLSLELYSADPAHIDVEGLSERLHAELQPFPFVPGTHFTCAFGHLDGYSAGYYTYMWSLVIAKDFFSRFDPANLLDPAPSLAYRRAVLEIGGAEPAAEIVRGFLGRDFSFDAYREWLEAE